MDNKDTARAFGVVVKTRRQARSLTQKALAAASKVSPRGLQNVEYGSESPSLFAADRIAKALGSDLGEMLAEAEDMLRMESEEKRPDDGMYIWNKAGRNEADKAAIRAAILEPPEPTPSAPRRRKRREEEKSSSWDGRCGNAECGGCDTCRYVRGRERHYEQRSWGMGG